MASENESAKWEQNVTLELSGEVEDIRPDQLEDDGSDVDNVADDEVDDEDDIGEICEEFPNISLGKHTQSADSLSHNQVLCNLIR